MKKETTQVEIKGTVQNGKVTLDNDTLKAISGGTAGAAGDVGGVSPRDGFVAVNAPFIAAA